MTGRAQTIDMYPTDAQVIVVGAGPVGLFTALLLKNHGIDVVIVERQKALYPLPRAVAFDHESRRLMESIGLGSQLDAVLQQIVSPIGGQESTNFNWRDKDFKRKKQQPISFRSTTTDAVVSVFYSHCGSQMGRPD